MSDITEVDQEHWRSVIKAEIDGLFFCVKHALPHMREAGFGRIIALSMAGIEQWTGPPHDYILGKAARNSFIRSLAANEIENSITCNVVAPGNTPHVTLKQAVEAAKHAGAYKRRTHTLPQDVAEVVRFLCSDEGTFVNGSVIELAGTSK